MPTGMTPWAEKKFHAGDFQAGIDQNGTLPIRLAIVLEALVLRCRRRACEEISGQGHKGCH